ncbi:MAG: TRAP transporter small permease [Synergistaceae bacterium]|nr:TRAP transporter small permease [Synergistaceae bacterium]
MERFGKMISLLLLPLVVIIVYSALKAYLLNDTPIWTFEISLFLYGLFFMLGAAYTHKEKKHVAVDVLTHYVSPRTGRILAIIAELVVFLVALAILWVSVPGAWRSFLMKERSTHQTPFNPQVWWFRWVIPISCALISWQAFRDMIALILSRPEKTGLEGK